MEQNNVNNRIELNILKRLSIFDILGFFIFASIYSQIVIYLCTYIKYNKVSKEGKYLQKEIKYTYIAKDKSTDSILINLTHSLKSFDEYINGYKIFDNIEYGMRMYPGIIQENVIVCSKEELIDNIKKHVDDVELILLNCFDIDLDEIKEVYAKIVDEYDIMLCINRLYDVKENVSITIEPSICSLSEEK